MEAGPNDDDGPWDRAGALQTETWAIVDRIGALTASTMDGFMVKVRAIGWCCCGDPSDAINPEEQTMDRRLLRGLLHDMAAADRIGRGA